MDTGGIALPESAPDVPDTPPDVRDEAIEVLRSHAPGWCETSIEARIELLAELARSTLAAAPAWVTAAAAAKGIPRDSAHLSEDWGTGIVPLLRSLRLLEATLRDVAASGRPRPPGVRTSTTTGQVVVDVHPAKRTDALLLPGFRAEVRIREGLTLEQTIATMGRIYRPGHRPDPGVALVLGAGNVSSIGPMDVLTQLFAHDRVVLLKPSPVNAHLGAHIAEAFEPLVRAGFLRIVYGGSSVGAALAAHDGIAAVHVTGSDATHDALVFGTDEGAPKRPARVERLLTKPVTSELGSITPVIVVPGPWSDRDVVYHGDNLASMVVNNAGFNGVAARVVVQHRAWSKRRALLEALRASLREAEERVPYYPGAVERWRAIVDAHPTAEPLGAQGDDRVPFTLVPDLDPRVEEDLAFTTEAFCGIVGEVALDTSRSIPDYLDEAVAFCNDVLWGTLAVTLIVHPRSLADPEVASAVERAVDGLNYGTVVLNHWPGVAFALASTPWGGAPGSDLTDIQSGRGFVHNTYLLEDVEKSVVRGPFRSRPTPVWFHTNRGAARLLPALAAFTATDDPRRLPGLVLRAARG